MEKPFPAYRGDEPYVFVCYAHEDSEIVYAEIAWLHGLGVNIWYDEGISAGKNWRAEIGRSLLGASRILFYISQPALISDHCNREINLALDEGKDIVPVYLEPVELTPDLKIGLNRVQALTREQTPGDSYRSAILAALAADDPGDGRPTPAQRPHPTEITSVRRSRHLYVWGGAAVIGIAASLWLLLPGSNRPTTDSAAQIAEVIPEQLTANPVERSLTSAAMSPDGRYLAYITPKGLYLQVLATRDTHEVEIDTDIHPTSVKWYPDGTRLLIIEKRSGGAPALWAVSTFGGKPVRIADNVARAALSPDGEHIAYIPYADSLGKGRREVWRMGSDGTDPQRLLAVGAGDSVWDLAWSPDSSRLAIGGWSYADGLTARIETIDLAGADRRTLLSDVALFQHWTGILPFSWCGTDRFVFAKADDPLTSNVWISDASPDGTRLTGTPTRLTRWVGANVRALSTSQDCAALTTLLVRNQADVFVAEFDAAGTTLLSERKVTYDEREDRVIGWSRDGDELIVSSSRSGVFRLYRKHLASDTMEAVVSSDAIDQTADQPATWDPSGEWLLYLRNGAVRRTPREGGASIEVMDGNYRTIQCVQRRASCVAGHVDDDRYVFTAFDPIEGLPTELVWVQHRGPFTNWDLSPNGERVAVVHNDDDEISLVSLESGTTSTLKVPGWRNIEYLSWAAAGDALYINPGFSVSGNHAVLLRIELDGQITMLRDRPNEWHVFPRVSPNGHHLAFSVMPFHGNAWLLEDFQ